MSNTLETFWHDATSDCELAPRRLMELYTQLLNTPAGIDDQCSRMLIHSMRKKLIALISNQVESAFIMQTLNNNRELKLILKELHEVDKRVSQIIWERAIKEIYAFIDNEEIIKMLMQLNDEEIQVFGLQCLLNEFQMGIEQNEKFLSLFTHTVSLLMKSKKMKDFAYKSLNRVYKRLPKELRDVYKSSQQQIGLLNFGHWEYLYAPRENGPDSERRTPLTWRQEKNTTDSDGYFNVEFNSNGLIAFSSRYGVSNKFLYADIEHYAYFWLGSGSKSSQWWHIIWPYDTFSNVSNRYLMFQNHDTNEFLCATAEYDENRRYVTLLSDRDSIDNPACQWLVESF